MNGSAFPGFPTLLMGALSLPFFLSGCLFEKESAEPLDIFPLAVGNTWVYVDSTYSGNSANETGGSETSIVGMREVTLAGKTQTVFLANNHAVGGPPALFSSYVKNFGHSNYNCGAENDSAQVTGKSLHLEYPTRNGRRYTTFFYNFATAMDTTLPVIDTLESEVVDTRHTCTVPAGTFACVEFRGYRHGTLIATAWHAPGVGYLGYEITHTTVVDGVPQEIRTVKRLLSYTLH